jgi:hypothetical protein
MATTPILSLTNTQLADPGNDPRSSGAKENFDAAMNTLLGLIDTFAGQVTGSYVTRFTTASGSVPNNLVGGDMGSSYTRSPRVLQEVIAYAPQTGALPTAFTQIDIQMQDGAGVFNSIFSANNLKPCVTASLGNYAINKVAVFRTGSWPAGRLVRAVVDASNAGTGSFIVCELFWKPSGSYTA